MGMVPAINVVAACIQECGNWGGAREVNDKAGGVWCAWVTMRDCESSLMGCLSR